MPGDTSLRKLDFFLLLLILALPAEAQINQARMLSGINSQTGTSYTFVPTDVTKLVTFNNGSAVSVTLPSATTQYFGAGTIFSVKNLGSGTVTITPTSGTINGAPSISLASGEGGDIYSDGANYVMQGGAASTPPVGFPRLDQVTDQNTGKIFNQGGANLTFTGGLLNLSGDTLILPNDPAGCSSIAAQGQVCFDSTGFNFHGYGGTDDIFARFSSSVTSGQLATFNLDGSGKWTLTGTPVNDTSGANTLIQAQLTNVADGDTLCWDSGTSEWVNCTPGVPPIVVSATSYTFDGTERGEILYFTANSAKAVSLPQAQDGTDFNGNWFTFVKNDGSGDITITATTSTFFSTGGTTLTIGQGIGCSIFSDPSGTGTYYDRCSPVPLTASTNITLTPAAYAISIAAAGGGGGTITGSGTANTVTKWTGTSTVGNGCGQDDGTHAVRCDAGYDVNQLGSYLWWATNNTVTGTTASKMACDDGTGKAIICPSASSTTNNPLGVAVAANGATPGTSGSTGICIIGFCSVIFDNSATAGHFAQSSSTVNGDLSDVGTTAPTNGQSYWYVFSGNSGAGTAAIIRNLSPSELNASSISGGNGRNLQLQVNSTAITKPIAKLVDGTGITFALSNSGNTTTITPTVTVSSGLSGMTAGQVAIAATASTVTSSKAIQGTDTSLLSSGTVSGTGATLCTDANGGATTSGCSAGGSAYATLENAGTAITQRTTLNFIGSGSANVSCLDNSGSSRSDCTVTGINGPPSPTVNPISSTTYTIQNSDNTWRDVFTASNAVSVTLPQANTISSAPYVSNRAASNLSSCTTCSPPAFSQSSGNTLLVSIIYNDASITVSSVTDSAGDTFTQVSTPLLNSGTPHSNQYLYQAQNIAASASNTLTVTFTGAVVPTVIVDEYALQTFDHGTSGTFISPSTPSITVPISFSQEVAYAVYHSGVSQPACPSGWTRRGNVSNFAFTCERLLASQSSVTFAYSDASQQVNTSMGDWQIASTPTFTAGWYVTLENVGTSKVTVTPTTSTINGHTTLVLYPNQVCQVMSDGTNYDAICGSTPNRINNGIPGQGTIIYGADQTGQTAAITDTTMFNTSSNSVYRFSGTIDCTTTSAAATASLNLKWTDTSNTAQTLTVTSTCTTLGASSLADMVRAIRAKSGTTITYGVSIANTPTYDVSVRLEAM